MAKVAYLVVRVLVLVWCCFYYLKEDFVNGFSLNVHDNANELSIFCVVLCVEFRFELYAGMVSNIGIKARDSYRGEYSRKPILKNAAG